MPPVAARRRSPVVAPDITVGRGDEEVRSDDDQKDADAVADGRARATTD
jgi:hypothetical protein